MSRFPIPRGFQGHHYDPIIFSGAFSPTDLPNLFAWYRADLGVTDSSGITNWNDQSGTGVSQKNLTATGTAKPTLNATDAAYNNKPTVSFNGTTNWMFGGSLGSPLAQPCTIYAVGQIAAASFGYMVGGQVTPAARVSVVQDTGNVWSLFGGGAVFADAVVTTVNPNVICGVYNNGSASQIYVNDYAAASGTATLGTNSLSLITLGGLDNSGALTAPMNGKIAEVIMYSGAHSSAQRQSVMAYLKSRYAL